MEGRASKRARTLGEATSEDLVGEVSQRCQALVEKERSLADLEGRVLALTKDLVGEVSQRCQALVEKERSLADLEGRVLALTKDPGEVLDINAGGKVFSVRRDTLCLAKGSVLAALFSGNWEEGQSRDSQGRPFLDIDPYIFGKLVNYLRQRRIEAPESPAPLPVIDADKQAEFKAMAKYYGLAECVPDVKKMQRLSPSAAVQTTNGATPRGYKLTFGTPVVLHAVGVGISGPTAGAMVWVGDGQGSTLREIPVSANQTLPPKWASTDPEVTCVAEGFALTLQPPGVFIMVKGLAGDMIFKYGSSNKPRQAGPFAVTSYDSMPPIAAHNADMFMSMEFVSVAA